MSFGRLVGYWLDGLVRCCVVLSSTHVSAGACLCEPFLGKVVCFEPRDRDDIAADITEIKNLMVNFSATRVVILHTGDSSRDDVSSSYLLLTFPSLRPLPCSSITHIHAEKVRNIIAVVG